MAVTRGNRTLRPGPSSPSASTRGAPAGGDKLPHLAAELTADLTDEQARAVVTRSRTVCVLAAAGAGKTRVLTRRIAFRLAAGSANPEHVLAITFTRKAAGELRERLATSGGAGITAGTFHSLALAQLRRYWTDRRTPAPTLIESKLRLLAEIVSGRPALQDIALPELASSIEWAKARALDPEQLPKGALDQGRELPCDPEELAALYLRYEHEKKRRRLVDFDDLLAHYADALRTDARFAAAQRWRWRHIFVDEIQDVNPLQCRLLEALVADNDDFFVVGDPNQAIYGWNGSDPDFLLHFPSRWPNAEVIHLNANHRSTPEIVAAASSVLRDRLRTSCAVADQTTSWHKLEDGATAQLVLRRALSTSGPPGPAPCSLSSRANGPKPDLTAYDSDESEAMGIALAIRKANEMGSSFCDMAVLTRSNAQHAALVSAMAQLGVAARAVGTERTVVEDGTEPATAEMEATALGPTHMRSAAKAGAEHFSCNAAEVMAEEAVTVSSFHRAKGLQWKEVWVAGLEQGLVPIAYATTEAALAEERRLLYVALTRAEERLHCSWAASRRTTSGAVLRREPSMWLDLLGKHCMTAQAVQALGPGSGGGGGGVQGVWKRSGDGARSDNMIDLVNAARRRLARARSPLTHPPTDDPVGDAVASSLREWRRRMARASGVPPYVILHDSTVELLAHRRPTSSAELLALPGMGPVKVSRFGPAVCEVIRESLSNAMLQEGA